MALVRIIIVSINNEVESGQFRPGACSAARVCLVNVNRHVTHVCGFRGGGVACGSEFAICFAKHVDITVLAVLLFTVAHSSVR